MCMKPYKQITIGPITQTSGLYNRSKSLPVPSFAIEESDSHKVYVEDPEQGCPSSRPRHTLGSRRLRTVAPTVLYSDPQKAKNPDFKGPVSGDNPDIL